MASSSSSSSSSPLSSTSSSSAAAMSSSRSSSSSSSASPAPAPAAASSSPAPAPAPASPAPAPAPPMPGLLDDTAFPALGTAPPRPPRSGIEALPTTSAERRSGRKTIIAIGLPLSLYGRRGLAAAGTAATPEELDAAAETAATDEELESETAATDEEREVEKTSGTAEAGGTASATSSSAATISARPPICASPGSLAEAAALLSGAPTLSPAAQAFGGYMFGTTFGDLFQDLEALQGEPQDVEPPLYYQPPPPRDLSLVVPLQGPPPQFVAPRLAHYGNATRPMQFAAPPQHMRFHLYAPPSQRYDDFAPTPPLPSLQGPLPQFVPPRLGIQPHLAHYGNAAPHHHAAIQRCQDCWIRPPAVQLDPCGHVSLCVDCYDKRQRCPCCASWIEWGPVYNLSAYEEL